MALLMWALVVGVVSVLAFDNPTRMAPVNLILGSVVIVVALVPMSAWLTRSARVIPLLPMHGAFYAACFGFAGLLRLPDAAYTVGGMALDADYTMALCAALLSWVMILAGYRIGIQTTFRMPHDFQMAGTPVAHHYAVILFYPVLLAASVWAFEGQRVQFQQMAHTLRLFVFIWVVHAAWTQRLMRRDRLLVLAAIIPGELFMFSGIERGDLSPIMRYGQLICITYAVTHRRVPVLVPALIIGVFLFLQPAKGTYRLTRNAEVETMGPVAGLVNYLEMAWQSAPRDREGIAFTDLVQAAYARLNHLYTLALVISDTPERQPYRWGSTLTPLLTKWIPRLVWPGKPREEIGNNWARDYGYLNEMDYNTSYNLAWVVEMFINGGWIGVAVLSLAIGALMGWLRRGFIAAQTGSPYYAFALLTASAFFFPESNMSAQLGGAFSAATYGLACVFVMARLTGTSRMTLRQAAPRPSAGTALG